MLANEAMKLLINVQTLKIILNSHQNWLIQVMKLVKKVMKLFNKYSDNKK